MLTNLAGLVGHLYLSSLSTLKKENFIILLSASMASTKNTQASSTSSSTRLSASIIDNYSSLIARSRLKALNQLQFQSNDEAKVQIVISLDFLTSEKIFNKELSNLKHLKFGAKPPCSFTRSCSHDSSYVIRRPRAEFPLVHMDLLSPQSSSKVVSIMMTNTFIVEEKMVEMEQNIILLTKALRDRDIQIATLMSKPKVKDSDESS